MFGWIKDKAQNAVYATSLKALASHSQGKPEILAPFYVAIAHTVLDFSNTHLGQKLSFEDLARGPSEAFRNCTSEQIGAVELSLLDLAGKMEKSGAGALRHVPGIAAGFFSAQKRRDFSNDTSVAIVNIVRSGAEAADTLGVSQYDDLGTVMEKAKSFARSHL